MASESSRSPTLSRPSAASTSSARGEMPLETLFARVENMHGTVNLDAMSTLLQAMLSRIMRQEQLLTTLHTEVRETIVPSCVAFRESLESLGGRMFTVEQKVDDALRASTAQLMDSKFSAGEVCTSNYYQLQKISKTLTTFITRSEVEAQYQSLMIIKEDNAALHVDMDKLHAILNEINVTQAELHETFSQQETRLSLKLDRSELPRLQSLAKKILTYEEFKDDIQQRVKTIEGTLPVIHTEIDTHGREIVALRDMLEKDVLYNMSKMALKKDVHVLAKELKAQQAVLETVAFESDIEQLRAILAKTSQRIDENRNEIDKTRSRVLSVEKVLPDKALRSEVALCLLKKDFEESIANTNSEIQTKTDIPFTEALQAHIQLLEQRVLEESQKTAVAIKFVDWFMSRGQNYEHNIRIIDRHLKDLIPDESALKHTNLQFFDMKDIVKR